MDFAVRIRSQISNGGFAVNRRPPKRSTRILIVLVSIFIVQSTTGAASLILAAQSSEQPQAPAAQLSSQELQQLVAPIALYPDALVAQVLAASTYPTEIV